MKAAHTHTFFHLPFPSLSYSIYSGSRPLLYSVSSWVSKKDSNFWKECIASGSYYFMTLLRYGYTCLLDKKPMWVKSIPHILYQKYPLWLIAGVGGMELIFKLSSNCLQLQPSSLIYYISSPNPCCRIAKTLNVEVLEWNQNGAFKDEMTMQFELLLIRNRSTQMC